MQVADSDFVGLQVYSVCPIWSSCCLHCRFPPSVEANAGLVPWNRSRPSTSSPHLFAVHDYHSLSTGAVPFIWHGAVKWPNSLSRFFTRKLTQFFNTSSHAFLWHADTSTLLSFTPSHHQSWVSVAREAYPHTCVTQMLVACLQHVGRAACNVAWLHTRVCPVVSVSVAANWTP